MSNACATAEVLLTTQIDKVLRRSRAVQRRPVDRSPETQRMSSLICDQLEALVCAELQPERTSD
jgi:hypothetical protein